MGCYKGGSRLDLQSIERYEGNLAACRNPVPAERLRSQPYAAIGSAPD